MLSPSIILTLKSTAKKISAGLAIAGAIGMAMPVINAEAGHRHHRHYHGGAYVGAGIVGMTLGAIVAGSAHRRWQRADRLYYQQPAYIPPRPVFAYPEPYRQPPMLRPEAEYGQPYRDDIPQYHQSPNRDQRLHSNPGKKYGESDPNVLTYDDTVSNSGLAEPWSPKWYSYCRRTFRSFNETKGTYRGYDGKQHFCIAK